MYYIFLFIFPFVCDFYRMFVYRKIRQSNWKLVQYTVCVLASFFFNTATRSRQSQILHTRAWIHYSLTIVIIKIMLTIFMMMRHININNLQYPNHQFFMRWSFLICFHGSDFLFYKWRMYLDGNHCHVLILTSEPQEQIVKSVLAQRKQSHSLTRRAKLTHRPINNWFLASC